MGKAKGKFRAMWLPLGVVLLLAAAMVLLSPGSVTEADDSLAEVRINPDSLSEERQYGLVALDSLLGLMAQLDPDSAQARVQVVDDSLLIKRQAAFPKSRFVRIYQNQRSSRSFRSLKNSPLNMLAGEDNGFKAPLRLVQARRFVVLPYDVVAGLLEAVGGNAPRPVTSSDKSK